MKDYKSRLKRMANRDVASWALEKKKFRQERQRITTEIEGDDIMWKFRLFKFEDERSHMMLRCPCSSRKYTQLTKDFALRVILGQLEYIGIPALHAQEIFDGKDNGGRWNLRIAATAIQMYACWQIK